MIKNKKDLVYYLNEDRKALRIEHNIKYNILENDIYKFQILLRKTEYYINCKIAFYYTPLRFLYRYLFKRKSIKLGFTIPLNVFGPGLSIAHYGTIVVNDSSSIGKNCRIHEGVTIGSTSGSPKAATIGDNVFIGTGAKIIGDISIANNVCIGANSVVTHSFDESGITIAGIPAKKISNNNSSSNLSPLLDLF